MDRTWLSLTDGRQDPCRGATISRVCCAYGSNGWFQKPETLYRDSSTTARDVALVKFFKIVFKVG
jgi:hypothetical protein